ncbi:MAG: hypothetical protein IE916_05800 [Epsilonproteobacteria bacterium]|nr:hypothetical protein [Campylobacterota bacterium]
MPRDDVISQHLQSGGKELRVVKKTQLFERSEFCVFRRKANWPREPVGLEAVARAFCVLFGDSKKYEEPK